MKQGSTVVYAECSPELHSWVKAYAASTGRKMREVVIEALETLRSKVTKKSTGN
jgi:hypothetical protein